MDSWKLKEKNAINNNLVGVARCFGKKKNLLSWNNNVLALIRSSSANLKPVVNSFLVKHYQSI